MHYMHKGCAILYTPLGLIFDQTINDNFKASHVNSRDMCTVGYYVEAYETCLQNKLWTHYEVQYLPFFAENKLFCSIYLHQFVIFFLMHQLRSSYFVSQIIGESITQQDLKMHYFWRNVGKCMVCSLYCHILLLHYNNDKQIVVLQLLGTSC